MEHIKHENLEYNCGQDEVNSIFGSFFLGEKDINFRITLA